MNNNLKTKTTVYEPDFFQLYTVVFIYFSFMRNFSDTKATHFIFNTHAILTTASPPLLIAFRNLSRRLT